MYEMVFESMLFRLDTFSVLMPLKTLVCVCVVTLPMEQFCSEAFPIDAFDMDTFTNDAVVSAWCVFVTHIFVTDAVVTQTLLKDAFVQARNVPRILLKLAFDAVNCTTDAV